MSELRQFHPSLRVSKVQKLKNNRFLVIGDTPRDVAILQRDNKMKACLGQNVSASLPKAYQTAEAASKTLVVKRLPTRVSEKDFKEFLDLNEILYAKAERLTSIKDGRVLQLFNPISARGWNPTPSRFFPRHRHKYQPINSKLSDF